MKQHFPILFIANSITRHCRMLARPTILLCLFFLAAINNASAQPLQPSAIKQIRSLMAEKDARTPAQKKISSNILYANKMWAGNRITADVATLETGVKVDARGRIKVDIDAAVTPKLLSQLTAMGVEIIFASEKFASITANVPANLIEQVAMLDAVKHIQEWIAPIHNDGRPIAGLTINQPTRLQKTMDAATRRKELISKIKKALGDYDSKILGAVTSQAVAVHKVDLARAIFNVDGSGIKIGVLSDSYNSVASPNAAADVASGDLPGVGNPFGRTTPVTVLQDVTGSDEGRAMLQLIHDIAPGAQLYFATAVVSKAGFAQNILNLRAAGCDIIVDDVSWLDESVFQDDIVAQAVNTVTASGALYFSAAGNSGNKNDNTAGVWEGDFVDAGAATGLFLGQGLLHNFGGGVVYNTVTYPSSYTTLKWGEPKGQAASDYDLYVTNAAGTAIVSTSNTTQDGDDEPLETIYPVNGSNRLYIIKHNGTKKALNLNTNRGQLSISTSGATFGHNAAASAYCVAATVSTFDGPVFNSSNTVETFSSDGLRRMFFSPNGTEITPGNIFFGTNGGVLLQKPDITAADGNATTLPGFNLFYGTSAAAPNAAAIAALLKSKLPAITPAQVRTALTSSAIDIETPGVDRDAGFGIVMAYEALVAAGATTSTAYLDSGAIVMADGAYSNSNGFADPGEVATLTVQLKNLSPNIVATNVVAVLSSSTPGITITRANVAYSNIPGSGSSTNTALPYLVGLDRTVVNCNATINFTLTVTYAAGSTKNFNFSVKIGKPQATITATLGSAPPTGAGFVATSGNQTSRTLKDGTSAVCGVAQAVPSLLGASGTRAYHAYTFTNSSTITQCVKVVMKSNAGVNLFCLAYNNAGFIPATPNLNFLGSPGVNANFVTYSVNVPASQQCTIVVHESNAGGGLGAVYTLDVDLRSCGAAPACASTIITTTTLPAGALNIYYNKFIGAAGPSGSYQLAVTSGSLPAGLSLSPAGLLSGTPTAAGTFPTTVTATDVTGCPLGSGASKSYNLVIAANPCILLTGPTAYVKADAIGNNSGESWTNAYKTLQQALTAARLCTSITKIWVAKGTYYPDQGGSASVGDRNARFDLINNVPVYGGFSGVEVTTYNLALRNVIANQTILSGNIGNTTIETDNSYSVVYASSSVTNATVADGFTVTGASGGTFGSGFNLDGAPTISNCTITGNSSDYTGGGIFCRSAAVIDRCVISGNTSALFGGGLANAFGGTPTVTNCIFTGNTAALTGGGGGIYSQDAAMKIINSTFYNNTGEAIHASAAAVVSNVIAWGTGSGVYNAGGAISNSIVQGGYAPCTNCPSGNGGADPLFVSGTNLRLACGSPALDAGSNILAPTTDLDGYIRPSPGSLVDIGAYEKPLTATWLGLTSDWHTASNWSTSIVPDACTNVIVNAAVPNYPVVTGTTAICQRLTVNNGARVQVITGAKLTVTK